jgi:sulfur-carrier protein
VATVKLVYFAWVREKIGLSHEMIDVPPGTTTVNDLMTWLQSRGPEYASAFAKPQIIRAAIDQTHVKHGAAIADAREIAFFPPVTGG